MEVERMRRYVILALGVAICLMGAALMVFGKGLLGENHTGIAGVIGIIGIGLIARSSRSSEEAKSSTRGGVNG
jgi:hypothetical protein